MSKRILIVTKPRDEHAHIVATGLELMGVESTIFRFGMMPFYETHTVAIGESAEILVNKEPLIDVDNSFDRIWLRRIGPTSITLTNISPNDAVYVSKIMSAYRTSFFTLLAKMAERQPDCMVNKYSIKISAESKMLQLMEAKRVGLVIPDTIQSNDPSAVRDFQAKHGGRIICKALVPHLWAGDDRRAFCYTTILPDVNGIPADSLRLHPAIYQPYIDKAFEARIIIFGKRQFGIKIESQSDPSSQIDWRGKRLYKNNNEIYYLPQDVFSKCIDLMHEMGLDYGAFDFIITPKGDHIFLEVNESGQFVFVEDCAPGNRITHAFCHFLIHGNLESWSNDDATFSLKDILESHNFKRRRAEDLKIHDFDSPAKVTPYDDGVGALNKGS